MTTGEMLQWTERFKNIVGSKADNNIKTFRLSNLMSDLEGVYSIPLLRSSAYEKSNPHVMQLYRSVSEARVFE